MNNLMNILGLIFGVYFAVSALLVIAGRRKIGQVIMPIIALVLALSFLPSFTAYMFDSFFTGLSPWWIVGCLSIFLLIAFGVGLLKAKR